MRNEVPDDSAVGRRNRRRKQVIAGAAGLTVLGAGALLVTFQVDDQAGRETRDPAALAPIVTASVHPIASATASSSVAPSALASPSVKASAAALSRTDRERVKAARSAAAKASGKVRRPLASQNGGATVAAADIKSTVIGSLQQNKQELRLYSARQDLTGQKELAWVTDDYDKVGNANCTNKIRLSQDVKPRARPTLLICWRTSETKSVYTVAVKIDGRPSKAKSIAAINKEWARLS
jgi:hypothetical protein